MEHYNLFMPRCYIHVISSVFLMALAHTALSVDQQFKACEPKNCGSGPNISYPFWIQNNHPDYCGYPGFRVICRNDEPILRVSNSDYILRNISYRDQSFSLLSSGAIGNSCPAPLQNFTITDAPYEFGQNIVCLLFLYNCTTSYSDDTSLYPVRCNTDPSLKSFGKLLPWGEFDDSIYSSMCSVVVGTPVDLDGELSSRAIVQRNYELFLGNGFALTWNFIECIDCLQTGGRCGFGKEEFVCFCSDRPHSKHCNTGAGTIMGKNIGIGLGSAIPAVLVIAIICLCWKRGKFSSKFMVSWKTKNQTFGLVEIFLENCGSSAPERFSYSDIKKITNTFQEKIGQGGYGEVYRGKLSDSRPVAVKLLSKSKGNGEDFINEVASISKTSHVNIVSLYGFCFDGTERALVYEYMANGSLEKFIYDQNTLETQTYLGWESLYHIATGVARGLEYLHRGCNTLILHFDIKPHNILLDQNFSPKISDFGLAKLYSRNESVASMLNARGTVGYIAPEMFNRNFGKVSHKSDVYSYGMMVLEMVGKRKNIDVGVDHTSEIYFPHWIYKRIELHVDLEVGVFHSELEEEITRKMLLVALWCIQTNPINRPAMSNVVEMLEGKLELLSIPPKPYLSSPPRSLEAVLQAHDSCV